MPLVYGIISFPVPGRGRTEKSDMGLYLLNKEDINVECHNDDLSLLDESDALNGAFRESLKTFFKVEDLGQSIII